MNKHLFADVIEGLVQLIPGLYFTLRAYHVFGKQPGESIENDQWHQRYGMMCKVIGPTLITFGLVKIVLASSTL